ncbi:hypothetical protein B0H14DRAFT_2565778 [Mycena olivaceomarginata]|nr:hypothetical protein B0H14DRAFT_2565778 [Mycena olivaceomarginata]
MPPAYLLPQIPAPPIPAPPVALAVSPPQLDSSVPAVNPVKDESLRLSAPRGASVHDHAGSSDLGRPTIYGTLPTFNTFLVLATRQPVDPALLEESNVGTQPAKKKVLSGGGRMVWTAKWGPGLLRGLEVLHDGALAPAHGDERADLAVIHAI